MPNGKHLKYITIKATVSTLMIGMLRYLKLPLEGSCAQTFITSFQYLLQTMSKKAGLHLLSPGLTNLTSNNRIRTYLRIAI